MKSATVLFLAVFAIAPASLGKAAPAKEEAAATPGPDAHQELRVLCELSKMKPALLKSKEFGGDAAATVVVVMKMALAAVKTPDVMKALMANAHADPASKGDLWKKTAEQVGFKKWNCPTMKSF